MVKYALFVGCSAKTNTPELLKSVQAVSAKLNIELYEIKEASCCGATHLQDYNEFTALVLNARNLAYASKIGCELVTICDTCQFVLSSANERLKSDKKLLQSVNDKLAEIGMEYKCDVKVKALLDVVNHAMKSAVIEKPFNNFNIAPYFGCHALGSAELKNIVKLVGGNVVEYVHSNSACGFHAYNQNIASQLAAKVLTDAIDQNADIIVTSCPLCHLSLDAKQKAAQKAAKRDVKIPVLHAYQMIGLALGIDKQTLGFNHNFTTKFF